MENRDLEEDLKVLADAFFENLCIDNVEYGGIGVDSKRPFGNSDVETDILVMLDIEPLDWNDGYDEYSNEQIHYARDLYHEKFIPFLPNKGRRP